VKVFRWVPVPSLRSRSSGYWLVSWWCWGLTSPGSTRPRRPCGLAEDRRPVPAAAGLAGHGLHQPSQRRLRLHVSPSGVDRPQGWRHHSSRRGWL